MRVSAGDLPPSSALFWKHLWVLDLLWMPRPGAGTREKTAVQQVGPGALAEARVAQHQPAVGQRPRKRRLQQPNANVTLTLLPQGTGQQARMVPGGKLLEYSSPRWVCCYLQVRYLGFHVSDPRWNQSSTHIHFFY